MREKVTWLHPRSRQWHLLDYILVRRRGQRDVRAIRGCRRGDRPSSLHLQEANSPTASKESSSNELAQRLDNLPVAAAAVVNASVENRWCQLRDTVLWTALSVLFRSHRQHQYWFDDKDAAISNLLVEKNHLHKAYVDRPTDDNRAAF
ncbi:hypothetical protein SprV_0100269700 [Sparganum proliferum]